MIWSELCSTQMNWLKQLKALCPNNTQDLRICDIADIPHKTDVKSQNCDFLYRLCITYWKPIFFESFCLLFLIGGITNAYICDQS